VIIEKARHNQRLKTTAQNIENYPKFAIKIGKAKQ